MGVAHYSDGSGAYLGAFSSPPPGGIARPAPASADMVWNGSAWETPIETLRTAAVLTRGEFLVACIAAGIITEAVADEASTGAWPADFNQFLSGLTVSQRIDAKAAWADLSNGGQVRRNSPILALVAENQNVTQEQLDTMFGISV